LRPQAIRLHARGLLIGPDLNSVGNFLWLLVVALVVVTLSAAFVGWTAAQSLTSKAMVPLVNVTGELRRFASGDFTSRPVRSADQSELGQLVLAYNGAAAQVASAFTQREKSEQDMRLMLGEAGHEMRTPLTVISAYVEALERDGDLVPSVRERALSTLRVETRRLRDLVERMTSLARLDATHRGETEPVDVLGVIRDTVDQVTATRSGKVTITADTAYAIVCAQTWEVQEAIGNLLDNALKYGDETPVELAVSSTDESVVVRISNGGRAIRPSERKRLFRHFFRAETSAAVPGSGLGLAIVARAATRMGGSIVLEDGEAGERTTFRLTLPTFRGESA
jgi:signal transduction histidine kinase